MNKNNKIKKQTLISDYFKKQKIDDICEKATSEKEKTDDSKIVYGYNENTGSWHCLECGDDMGPTNPRQLCGKSYCHMYPYGKE